MDIATNAKAELIWASLSDSERFGIRFGMFPAQQMREAERQGWSPRELAVALMDVASKNGGMRA